MKTELIALLITPLVGMVVGGADLTRTVNTKDGFSLHIPSDWVEIPKNVLDASADGVAQMAPSASRQRFDYGFHLSTGEDSFPYPYILIKVNREGRIPESKLKSMKRVRRALERAETRADDTLSAFASNFHYGETYYDVDAHILWSRLEANVQEVGKVRSLLAFLLTEYGAIQIAGYATADDFGARVHVFEAIARSVVLPENDRYKPRFTDAVPIASAIEWSGVLAKAIGGATLGGVVVLVMRARAKAKRHVKSSTDDPALLWTVRIYDELQTTDFKERQLGRDDIRRLLSEGRLKASRTCVCPPGGQEFIPLEDCREIQTQKAPDSAINADG